MNINLNTSTLEDLVKIRHIGKRRAQLIIEKRNEREFRDLYELSVIPGLGKSRVNDIVSEGIAKV